MKVAPSPSEMTPKEKIIGIGNIKLGTSPIIENVALVDGTPTLIFCSSRAKQEKKNYTTEVITPLSQVTRLH